MIWVDITNLPHVLFFKDFIQRNDCFVTSREFGTLTDLLDSHGIDHTVIGSHAGRDLKDKLVESARRVKDLAEIISGQDIEIALSKHSVELPRVAFGLGIPVVQVVDNEYAVHQNRLFLNLASSVIVPEASDTKLLQTQGADPKNIVTFRGVCEAVQVNSFTPDPSTLDDLGLDDYIVVRPGPVLASYFDSDDPAATLIEKLKELGHQIVVIPREGEEYEGATTLTNVDSLNLMYRAKAVIGGGGTMNRESALLGTPTVTFYPQERLGVDRFLIDQGVMEAAGKDIVEQVKRLIGEKDALRERATTLLKTLDDPITVIEKEIGRTQ